MQNIANCNTILQSICCATALVIRFDPRTSPDRARLYPGRGIRRGAIPRYSRVSCATSVPGRKTQSFPRPATAARERASASIIAGFRERDGSRIFPTALFSGRNVTLTWFTNVSIASICPRRFDRHNIVFRRSLRFTPVIRNQARFERRTHR